VVETLGFDVISLSLQKYANVFNFGGHQKKLLYTIYWFSIVKIKTPNLKK
jgi:hypothetical protein